MLESNACINTHTDTHVRTHIHAFTILFFRSLTLLRRHIPDFTMSRITANLHIHVSNKLVLVYPLLTTLPHHMLPACYAAMPRPYWEVWVSKGLFSIMVLMLVLVVLLAWRDARAMTVQMNGDLARDLRRARQFCDAVNYYQQTHQANENALFHKTSREDMYDPLHTLRSTPSREENMRYVHVYVHV